MKKALSALFATLKTMDRNERFYSLGLVMMLIGLSLSVSPFVALAIVGSVMVVESVITSYIAGMINARSK